MQKIACLFSFKESNWVSCQKIVFNLLKSYQGSPELELKNFNFSESLEGSSDLEKLATEIQKFEPDVISVLDHKPHPVNFFKVLTGLYKEKTKPKILIHVFGDFTLYYAEWARCEELLLGFDVEFIVASDRQKILIDSLLSSKNSVVCPFPVDEKEFFFDQKRRNKQRDDWSLTERDVVFLFTGRLSRQKRIKTLVAEFAAVFENEPHAHLFFYGNPDNIGDPFISRPDIEGEYFRAFYREYESLSTDLQKRIHFMGAVPNSDLLNVYQGADFLVNLSVHNDEDYGMSVAESQFCGLPSILTDWGGLASFQYEEIPEASTFIPVKISSKGKLISRTKTKQALRKCFANHQNVDRTTLAMAARKKFGIERSSEIICKAVKAPARLFDGFSPLFQRAYEANFTFHPLFPNYINEHGKIKKIYKDLYTAYVRNT